MKRLMVCLICLTMLAPTVWAQDEMDEAPEPATTGAAKPPQPAAAPAPKKTADKKPAIAPAAPPPESDADIPPPPPPGTMDDMPVAELQALDKITARVSRLEVKTGDTTTFGSLTLLVKACRKAPPEDTPESAAFLQIWEQKPGEDSHWVYSGWMFASSPALAAMDHPVYDIWVVDCKKEPASPDSSPAK